MRLREPDEEKLEIQCSGHLDEEETEGEKIKARGSEEKVEDSVDRTWIAANLCWGKVHRRR